MRSYQHDWLVGWAVDVAPYSHPLPRSRIVYPRPDLSLHTSRNLQFARHAYLELWARAK